MATKKLSSEELIKSIAEAKKTLGTECSPKEILTKAKIKNPIVLFGSEKKRHKRIALWLYENLYKNNNLESHAYFGSDFTSSKNHKHFIDSLGTSSLFSKEEFIILHDSQSIKANIAKGLSELILKKLPLRDQCLIILGGDEKQKTGLATILADEGTKVTLSPLKGTNLYKWINLEAKNFNVEIEKDAILLLEKFFGGDSDAISSEIEKLSLLCDCQNKKITAKQILNFSQFNPEHNSFELLTAITKKDLAASTLISNELIDQGFHPLQLISFLSKCFRTLLSSQNNQKPLSPELSNPWFISKLAPLKNKYKEKELANKLEILKKLDFALKDGSKNEKLLTSLAIKELTN